MDLKVRYAEKKDLIFIDYLQKKNAEDLSFYPNVVLEREVDNQRILLALVNNEHAGYLYHGSIRLDYPLKIHQACIEYDLRGNWYGAGLCSELEKIAYIGGSKTISLRCGSDIAANNFWKNMGFDCVAITPGGVRRMRDINVWQKLLGQDLFGFTSIEPSNKKKSTKVWRQRDKSVKQNSMLRGKALLEYRLKLESILEEDL
jgi:hypothetical protein|tara:strand:+ start:64 stop:669 length:606 start_codon:yes stop_codon:yes gene_type:complete